MSNEQKNFKQNKATDGIDVEFSRELADHNDLEANARANAADARQNASQQKNKEAQPYSFQQGPTTQQNKPRDISRFIFYILYNVPK